jgi:hypothetical protein
VTYREEIGFPINPTKEDIKMLKQQVARDKFEVVDGKKKDDKKQDRRVKR